VGEVGLGGAVADQVQVRRRFHAASTVRRQCGGFACRNIVAARGEVKGFRFAAGGASAGAPVFG
jgi:hypothetical protein